MEGSSFSGSSKRAKAPGNIPQGSSVHCLVDECNADLSLCRDYHRRHKVCEIHSKTPKVTIGGGDQRFCQQCSRFHSLTEFDEGKRSCRKRLDGHNRRRRKLPQPNSLANSGLTFSTHQTSPAGTRLLSFANPPLLPTSPTWPAIIKLEPQIPLYTNHSFGSDCSPRSVSHLQFGLATTDDKPSNDYNNNKDNEGVSGCTRSGRALSLLSSTPAPQFHFVLPPTQPLAQDEIRYDDGGFAPVPPVIAEEGKAFGDGGANSTLNRAHFPEILGGDRTQSPFTGGPHQTLSFMWE